jgi:transposase
MFTLKLLLRDYYKLIDTRTSSKKKLSSTLSIAFCGYKKVFCDTCGHVSLNIFKRYPSPQAVISAPKKELVDILLLSKKGLSWAESKYQMLLECARNASFIVLSSSRLSLSISSSLTDLQADKLLAEIKSFTDSADMPQTLCDNIKLLTSIPGIGYITAVSILAEIGSIDKFLTPKQLVAFFGVDPAVNESG